MPFDALTLSHVEDALSDVFGYHDKLDSFLVRCGLPNADLAAARKVAEDRCAAAARRSFKLTGEQIDGSFAWREKTYLVEAKWTQKLTAGREFGAFDYKIRGKTVDTRGLFVSINGYSREVIAGVNGKGELRFICIDGTHLMHALSSDGGLAPLLEKLWRHADETGEAYLPAASL